MKRLDYIGWLALVFVLIPLLLGVVLGLGLWFGVWIPDLSGADRITVGRVTLPDGQVLEVLQKWTGDFYSTLARCRSVGSPDRVYFIDGDADRIWRFHTTLDPRQRFVKVPIDGGVWLEYFWEEKRMVLYSSWGTSEVEAEPPSIYGLNPERP